MSPSDADRLPDKAVVVAAHTAPPYKPHRVKRVWVSAGSTAARFQFVTMGDQWFDVGPWELPPDGLEWCGPLGWRSRQHANAP